MTQEQEAKLLEYVAQSVPSFYDKRLLGKTELEDTEEVLLDIVIGKEIIAYLVEKNPIGFLQLNIYRFDRFIIASEEEEKHLVFFRNGKRVRPFLRVNTETERPDQIYTLYLALKFNVDRKYHQKLYELLELNEDLMPFEDYQNLETINYSIIQKSIINS